jgi:hypothetical protein
MIYSSKTLRKRLDKVKSATVESKTGFAFYYSYDRNDCKGNVNYMSAIARDNCMTLFDNGGFPVASVKATCDDGKHFFLFDIFD